jgi:hypothetical protein
MRPSLPLLPVKTLEGDEDPVDVLPLSSIPISSCPNRDLVHRSDAIRRERDLRRYVRSAA